MKSLPVSRLSAALGAVLLSLLSILDSNAFPMGRTTFKDAAPFAGTSGVHSLTAVNMDSLLTVAAWADVDATVPANLYQWWWIFGVDSGAGNGALIDGTESMTLEFDKSVGAAMIAFLYTGGTGGATNNLARISISGFGSDPVAVGVPYYGVLVKNVSYASGTVSFDYLNDNASDYGQVMFSNPWASAGRTLKITGAVSPNGDATSWNAALFQVDVQEAWSGPRLNATSISHNTTSSYQTADSLLTIKGFSDRNAVTPQNLGRYQDECFGVAGGPGGNVVDTNESLTIQFKSWIGLSRLDTVYSSGVISISGFVSDPGFVDPSAGTSGANYSGGRVRLHPGAPRRPAHLAAAWGRAQRDRGHALSRRGVRLRRGGPVAARGRAAGRQPDADRGRGLAGVARRDARGELRARADAGMAHDVAANPSGSDVRSG